MPEINTVLGFDFGMKRIGVAVGQRITHTATALKVLAAEQGEPKWDEVAALIKEWRPQALVVGIPLNMDGTLQDMSLHAKHFAKMLEQKFSIPVFEAEERLSTKEARARIFSEQGYKGLLKAVDSVAAKIIVEDWLRLSGENNGNKT